MTVDTQMLYRLRLMRSCVDRAMRIADDMDDTLLIALFSDIEQTLTDRIVTLVSAPKRAA